MTSVRTAVIPRSNVDGRDVNGRRDVNGWRRGVIDRWRRSDVHRLWCKRTADNGSDTKSQQPRTNGGTITCMG